MTTPTTTRPTSAHVAVVTLVRGRRDHLARQQQSLSRGTVLPGQWVVVAMGDPDLDDVEPREGVRPTVVHVDADPASLPLAAARNAGAEHALTSRRPACWSSSTSTAWPAPTSSRRTTLR